MTTDHRNVDRRSVLTAGLGVGGGAGLNAADAQAGPRHSPRLAAAEVPAGAHGLFPGAASDQAAALQAAIDEAAARGAPLLLPPGRVRTGPLTLR